MVTILTICLELAVVKNRVDDLQQELARLLRSLHYLTLASIELCTTQDVQQAVEGAGRPSAYRHRTRRSERYLKGVRSSWLMDAKKLLLIFVAFRASSRLFLAASNASRCVDIIFKFSLVPACTERKSRAFAMPMLACSHSSVKMVTVFGENGYLDAKYTAPNVWLRLLTIGKQTALRCGLCRASEEN